VAVVGGGLGVIEDGLVRETDIKDVLQDVSRLAGADGKGDVEGQDEAKDILRVMNFPNVDEWLEWAGVNKFGRLEQIFAVNVAEFELRRFRFL